MPGWRGSRWTLHSATFGAARPAVRIGKALALVAVAVLASGADWPHWRGPERNDISIESSGWPDGWPPKNLWSKNVGYGCTSPTVVAGRMYVMGWHGEGNRRANPVGQDTLWCLDPLSGSVLWSQSYNSHYQGRFRNGDLHQYGGPSSTPTFDAESQFIYTLGIDGDLHCWDAARDGRPVWSLKLADEYGVRQRPNVGGGVRDFGFTSSPLVQGDVLILEVGGARGTVMAFDKRTGQFRWTSAYAGPAGHTGGPVPLTVGGVPCVANLALSALILLRVDKGREGQTVAELKWQTDFGCNIPTPTAAGGRLVLTSSYNSKKTSLIETSPGGATEKWSTRDHATVCSPVVHKGRVYLVEGPVRCLDMATGKRLWQGGGSFGEGSCLVTAGDDKLIAFGNGRLALIDASPSANQYKEFARLDGVVPATCYPHVVLSNGLIFCKDKDGNTVCLSARP